MLSHCRKHPAADASRLAAAFLNPQATPILLLLLLAAALTPKLPAAQVPFLQDERAVAQQVDGLHVFSPLLCLEVYLSRREVLHQASKGHPCGFPAESYRRSWPPRCR